MTLRPGVVLAVILFAAAVARFGFGAAVVGLDSPMKADESDYHTIAVNLISGNGYKLAEDTVTARRPPAYPALLALIYGVTGPSPAAGRVMQMLLGVAIVALLFYVARRYFDTRTALIAAAFCAVSPFLTFISGYMLTENLYVIVVLGALAFAPGPTFLDDGRARKAIPFALLLGIAALVRPTATILAGVIILCVFFLAGRRWQDRLRYTAVVGAVFAAVVLPWMLRNSAAMGGWVGLTTHGGITFFQGNNPKIVSIPHYRGGVAPLEGLPRYDELARMPERDRDRLAWRMGKEYLRHNWRDVPQVVWWKFARFWRFNSESGMSGIKSGWWFDNSRLPGRIASRLDVGFVYAIIAIPLFLLGLYLTRSRWREYVFLYAIVVAHTAVALVFFGSLRGRIPVEPVIALFAAAALVRVHAWAKQRLRPAQG